MDIEDFYTRERASQGVRVPLYSPTTGEKTSHWVEVLGIDSDEFRVADAEAKRLIAGKVSGEKDSAVLNEVFLEAKIAIIAALIVGWSFKMEFTPANVTKFLKEAPQIRDAIDEFVSKRSLFFAMQSSNSPNTPRKTSRSTGSRKVRSKVSGKV